MSLARRMPGRRSHTTALALLTLFAALVVPAASAHHGHPVSKVKGKWSNPVGACVTHVIKVDPATGDLLSCSGTSDWTGTWKGSTKWTLTGDVSLTTGGSGRIDEVFTGRARDGRKGKLTFREHFSLDASGNIDIKGKILKSSAKLEGSRGRAHWIGIANADGSGSGTYSGRWHEGPRPHHKRHHS
jgi:hypothetical protein